MCFCIFHNDLVFDFRKDTKLKANHNYSVLLVEDSGVCERIKDLAIANSDSAPAFSFIEI